MNKNKLFSSEMELGNFVASTDVIPNAYAAILKTLSSAPHHHHHRPQTSVRYEHHVSGQSSYGVLAFVCSSDPTAQIPRPQDKDLVSSENHKVVDFVRTKVNSSFSINRATVELFESIFDELSFLKNPQEKTREKPLIITGQSLGGSVAILVTLWLHHIIDIEESSGSKNMPKRPICITFGSPLVGDDAFQRAISERPNWKSCFLHVVATNDPVPRSMISSTDTPRYKPFGVYLFCSESGSHACFEEHDSILGVMEALNSQTVENTPTIDYGKVSNALKSKALHRGLSQLGDFNFNPLRAGITLQLLEVGVLNTQADNRANGLIAQMESKQGRLITGRRNIYEPTRKLNDMKISLTYTEWYMKAGKSKGGYYDSYKNPQSMKEIEAQHEIVKHQRKLNQYWKKFVEEKDQMPQKEGNKLRKRWLYGGTTYRRIIEPLDIAEHYQKRKTNYLAQRPAHYELLEQWLKEDKEDKDTNERRNKAASLTEDSCFWAHVEEAFISLRALKDPIVMSNTESIREIERKLVEFEGYIMKSISDFLVSTDIFLKQSTFMQWWSEYKAYKGSMYSSQLAQYMNMEGYKTYK